jgi:UDP:flavonoid glycosyltransferase YjiC (YdhE family)
MQVPVAVPADLDVAQLRSAIERTLTGSALRTRAQEIGAEIAAMPSPDEVALLVEAAARPVGAGRRALEV